MAGKCYLNGQQTRVQAMPHMQLALDAHEPHPGLKVIILTGGLTIETVVTFNQSLRDEPAPILLIESRQTRMAGFRRSRLARATSGAPRKSEEFSGDRRSKFAQSGGAASLPIAALVQRFSYDGSRCRTLRAARKSGVNRGEQIRLAGLFMLV